MKQPKNNEEFLTQMWDKITVAEYQVLEIRLARGYSQELRRKKIIIYVILALGFVGGICIILKDKNAVYGVAPVLLILSYLMDYWLNFQGRKTKQ